MSKDMTDEINRLQNPTFKVGEVYYAVGYKEDKNDSEEHKKKISDRIPIGTELVVIEERNKDRDLSLYKSCRNCSFHNKYNKCVLYLINGKENRTENRVHSCYITVEREEI